MACPCGCTDYASDDAYLDAIEAELGEYDADGRLIAPPQTPAIRPLDAEAVVR